MHTLNFDWNPVTGIDIVGNFKLHFYSLMWIIAFVIGWFIMKRIFTKEKVSLINLSTTGNELINGGEFGVEGSIILTILLISLISGISVYLIRNRNIFGHKEIALNN